MELQRLSLLNIKANKPPSQAKPARKPASSDKAGRRLSRAEEGRSPTMELLISVSNTIADSNGIDLSDSRLSFSVDDNTGETVVKIVDNESGETIRQIPPEEILSLKKRMGEVQGLLLDRKV